MKPSRDVKRLIEIMAALRHPQSGCPWDKVQTFQTIMPYTIEETYEVADAIKRNDRADLCEELGDLLLQVVYHARLAEEEGSFSFADVVESITKKMIRRHPHVFGTKAQRQAGMSDDAWERIKAVEKAEKQAQKAGLIEPHKKKNAYLDDVSSVFPPWLEALKLQKKAARAGFDWPGAAEVLQKLEEETQELTEAITTKDSPAIAAEHGDVLFTIINLGRKLNLDPDMALAMTNKKFRSRFSYIEKKLQEKYKQLEDASLTEMESLWQQAKTEESDESL